MSGMGGSVLRWVLSSSCLLASGCIDTQPGLALSFRDDPLVRVDRSGGEFAVEANFLVRVGTYALAGRGMRVARVEVVVDGEPLGWAAPSEYEGPTGVVSPGEEVEGRVLAVGRLDAFPRVAEVCDAASEDVGVVLSWLAEVDDSGGGGTGGPLRREMGRLEGVAGQVDCLP